MNDFLINRNFKVNFYLKSTMNIITCEDHNRKRFSLDEESSCR